MPEPKVGLDSQCLSYLLDAIAGIEEPTDSLSEERKALMRIWLYVPNAFYLSETVVIECAKIKNVDRREFHESFIRTLFLDMPIQDQSLVNLRANSLVKAHAGINDCRVLAEAEDLGLGTLLTYDRNFRLHLASQSTIVALKIPTEYWASLNIPRGARPLTVPHHTNPLSKQTWWHW